VALAFFLSSTAHDLAHALMARRRGMSVPTLAISFFGGATPLDPVPARASDDLAIAVSGPVASIGIGAVLGAVAAGLDAIGGFLVLSARSIGDRVRVNRLIGGLHVQDAMEVAPVSVGPNLTVDTFAEQLLDAESEMTAVPVVSDGNVVGILGARQLQRLQRR